MGYPSSGEAARVVLKPGVLSRSGEIFLELMEKVASGEASAEERERFYNDQAGLMDYILNASAGELFDVQKVKLGDMPAGFSFRFTRCDNCGEEFLSACDYRVGGKTLCAMCAATIYTKEEWNMQFDKILEKATERELEKDEALFLLENANDWQQQLKLLNTASFVRDKYVGRIFKLKAFAISTNQGCKTSPPCRYCGQASANFKFFKTVAGPEEVAESVRIAEEIGFKGVQLGGGCSGNKGAEAVEDARIVKEITNLDVFVNYGADMSEENIVKLKELGIGTIGCSFETINEEIFKKIKPGESLEERKKVAELIDKHGVGLASGIMIGVGETYEDRVEHIFYLKNFKNLRLVYISGFFPIPGTPMGNQPPATSMEIAKTMAITRLVHRHIDVDGSFGRDDQLQLWIMAGANHRIIHGIFEPVSKIGQFRRFRGETRKIGDDFVFMNILPIYVNMVKGVGLQPDLNKK